MKFIHLADCHVVGGGRRLYGVDPARRLRLAVDSINAEHPDAAFVVITGDLTHWGEDAAYATFAAEIERLSVPAHLMPGNHDDRAALLRAFPDTPCDPAGFVQMAFDTPQGRALLLDTKTEGTHAGGFCAARRDWLRRELEASDGAVLLFMHHPPFDVGIPEMDAIRLSEAEAFHEVVAPHKARIRHLFFGHVHRAICGNWRGISFSCMRGLNHQVALDLSTRPEGLWGDLAAPAYGVVLVDDDRLCVHMHDFTDRSPRFPFYPTDGSDAASYQLGLDFPDFDDL